MFGGSVSSARLTELQSRLSQTKTTLESGDATQISRLNREDLLGDMFYAGVLGYYSQLTAMSHVAGLKQKATQNILLTGGTYGYVPKVSYFFGFPRSIQSGRVAMDLNREVVVTGAWDGDKKKKFTMNQQTGMMGSALEHVVPEQMFISSANPGEAVSAVKLLSKAQTIGQSIYHITRLNKDTILPNLNLSPDIVDEITQSVNSGNEVITHTDNITVSGYTGAGYIIFDPIEGDGAYLIGGGLNGGDLDIADDTLGKTGWFVSMMEGFAEFFGWTDDALSLNTVGKGMTTISAITQVFSIGAKCSSDAARVLILFSTVLTLLSLAPGLLVGIGVLLAFEAIVIGLLLSIMFSLAVGYVVGGVCKE